jgi:hypothetical protein
MAARRGARRVAAALPGAGRLLAPGLVDVEPVVPVKRAAPVAVARSAARDAQFVEASVVAERVVLSERDEFAACEPGDLDAAKAPAGAELAHAPRRSARRVLCRDRQHSHSSGRQGAVAGPRRREEPDRGLRCRGAELDHAARKRCTSQTQSDRERDQGGPMPSAALTPTAECAQTAGPVAGTSAGGLVQLAADLGQESHGCSSSSALSFESPRLTRWRTTSSDV